MTETPRQDGGGQISDAVPRRLLADGLLDPGAETVIINSGDGLKTLDALADGASGAASPAAPIRPTLAAFRAFEDSLAAPDSA